MNQIVATSRLYQLDEGQNATIETLARGQSKSPEDLVREAVASYISTTVQAVDDEIEYQRRVAEIMANLKHPERDNSGFGSWRSSGIDGVEYQNALRGK